MKNLMDKITDATVMALLVIFVVLAITYYAIKKDESL